MQISKLEQFPNRNNVKGGLGCGLGRGLGCGLGRGLGCGLGFPAFGCDGLGWGFPGWGFPGFGCGGLGWGFPGWGFPGFGCEIPVVGIPVVGGCEPVVGGYGLVVGDCAPVAGGPADCGTTRIVEIEAAPTVAAC